MIDLLAVLAYLFAVLVLFLLPIGWIVGSVLGSPDVGLAVALGVAGLGSAYRVMSGLRVT